MTDFPEELQRYATEFDAKCIERHEMGAKKYGPVKFMEIDTPEMVIEELIDAANYLRYMYIRMRVIQEALRGSETEPVTRLGRDSFIGKGGQ